VVRLTVSKKLIVVSNGYSKTGANLSSDSFVQVYCMAKNIKRHLNNTHDFKVSIIASRKVVSRSVAIYLSSEIDAPITFYENTFITKLKNAIEQNDIVLIVVPPVDKFVNDSVNCFLKTIYRAEAPEFSLAINQRISGDASLIIYEDKNIDWIKNQ
jgi:hypothetical protein